LFSSRRRRGPTKVVLPIEGLVNVKSPEAIEVQRQRSQKLEPVSLLHRRNVIAP
jgi:hypothetical protein